MALFAVYASTLGLDAFADSDYGGDEPHYLLAARSLVDDGDLDVGDEYAARAYADFYPYELDAHGVPVGGRLHEPHGAGFPLLIAPAFAAAGAAAVELFLSALAALAMALAYLLARRVTPDPWALAATLAVGLSPPLVAYGGAVYPELAAGALLAGASLLALGLRARPRRLPALACFALIAMLPWLGPKFVPAGLVVAGYAFRELWIAGKRTLPVGGIELLGVSAIGYVRMNHVLYGGLTPYAAELPGESATDAELPLGYLERAYRLVALLIDRDYGLVRWAPVLALALVGAWLLGRARRDRLSAALPARRVAEAAAILCAAAVGAQFLVAALLAPTMFGFWFPGRHVVAALPLTVPLVAWAFRRFPRTGAVLAALGILASAWLYMDVRLGGGALAAGRPSAPWSPFEAVFPLFASSPLPYALAAAAVALLVLLALRERRHSRTTAGATRATYSG